MKSGIICFFLGVLVLCGGLAIGYIISHEEVHETSTVNKCGIQIFHDEETKKFIEREFKFLSEAFPYNYKEANVVETYDDFESRLRIINAYYLRTDFDWTTLNENKEVVPHEYKISFKRFKEIYEFIFNEKIKLSDIPKNYVQDENYINVSFSSGSRIAYQKYWKTEYYADKDIYRLYYVDFAYHVDLNTFDLNQIDNIDVSILKKYKPALMVITYKKQGNHYYLQRCEYTYDPLF